MSARQLATAIALAAVLGGCASMSEDACRVADWGRIGYQDGAQGYTDERLAEHAKACGKIGIWPDTQQWRTGWDNGVHTYCTPQVGWNEGMTGRGYNGVCRGRGEEAFLSAYQPASEIHRLNSRIEHNNSELRRLQGLLSSAPNDEVRHKIRDRMRSLDDDQRHLRGSMSLLQLRAPRH